MFAVMKSEEESVCNESKDGDENYLQDIGDNDSKTMTTQETEETLEETHAKNAHFITDEWAIWSVCLGTMPVSDRHTGINITLAHPFLHESMDGQVKAIQDMTYNCA